MPKGIYTRKKGIWPNVKRSLETRKRMSESHIGIKYSAEHIKNIRLGQVGEKSYKWRGEKASYRSQHSWISRRKGTPSYCEHCKNSSLPYRCYHWANISREYKRDINDYKRLCAKCHKKYDKKQR